MYEEEATETPQTPTSPTDRRRKRSIVFGDHPQIMQFDNNVESTDTNGTETNSDKENQDYELDNSHLNSTVDGPDISEQSINGQETNVREQTDTPHTGSEENVYNQTEKQCSSNESQNVPEIRVSNNNVAQTPANDIVYDETKPRRLPNPKKLHLDIQDKQNRNLQDSISYLISPDEPENESPGRRRRRKQNESLPTTKSEPVFNLVVEPAEDIRHQNERRVMLNGEHYQRSPDMSRRKLSHGASPVKKQLIDRSSPHTAHTSTPNAVRMLAPSTAHKMKRKMSSDARIGVAHERPQVVKTPPRRKYSSDARLVGHAFKIEEQKNTPSIDDVRKRKVSFDTTALVNGNRIMPLNDELHIPEVSEGPFHEHTEDFPEKRYLSPEDEFGEESPPTFYTQNENEDSYGSSTRLYNDEDDVEEQYYDNDTDSAGFDNRAYTADDEDSVSSYNQTPPQYHTIEKQQATPNQRLNNQPAVIPHTNLTHEPARNGKKISAVSLPPGLGYKGLSPEDGSGPKSILKRRDDTDSMISQESVNDRKFNVRKDSIALFTSQSGQVALQQVRQEHESQWKNLSGSRFKDVI